MTAAAAVLITAAAAIWLAPFVALAALVVRDFIAFRGERRRREQQDRETTPEWLALLAAVEPEPLPRRRPTDMSSAFPIYDAVSREFAKRELTDDRLAEQMERWS